MFSSKLTPLLKQAGALLLLVAAACIVPGDCGGFEQRLVPHLESIPTPAETPAKVIVNGRTSTVQSISIRDVANRIPPTFSGDKLKNTQGFAWYVSQHYALKTDLSDQTANQYLILLELAYPHLIQMFGREPTGIQQMRMAVVYAKDKQTLAQALASDGQSWDFGGGGLTPDECTASYVYPSGGLQYQMRYILLHEATHLFQLCLTGKLATPGWYTEGVADLLSHHVWEAGRQRLTLGVIDKATDRNWLDLALRHFREKPFAASETARSDFKDRDVSFLLVAYFMTDVERSLKFRIYRDEMFRRTENGKNQERSDSLIEDLFGPWAKLDADFSRWAARRRATFRSVEWGWEQDGDTLQSYGWPRKGLYSQMDLQVTPREKPAFDPLVLDYPASAPDTQLVGSVKRGVAEPAIGCLISWSQTPGQGEAGLGLGVEDRDYLAIMLDAEKSLIVDGADLGIDRLVQPLPQAIVQAIVANGHQAGLTVRIEQEALVLSVRAASKNEIKTFTTKIALTSARRERILDRPMALLSRGGRHEITPYLDIPRAKNPDFSSPAPPNRWANAGDLALYAVYRSAWRLGNSAPASLLALRHDLLRAADGSKEIQLRALALFADRLLTVLSDLESGNGPNVAREDALTWLRRSEAE